MASVVWDFFKVSEENSSLAICNKCNAEVPRGGKRATSYNTSNLISHLMHHHQVMDGLDGLWMVGLLKAYDDARAAKAAANPKPAAKEPAGLVPIVTTLPVSLSLF